MRFALRPNKRLRLVKEETYAFPSHRPCENVSETVERGEYFSRAFPFMLIA